MKQPILEQKINSSLSKLGNLSAKEEIGSPLRAIEKEVRESVAELLEEKRKLEILVETLIDESDEGVNEV